MSARALRSRTRDSATRGQQRPGLSGVLGSDNSRKSTWARTTFSHPQGDDGRPEPGRRDRSEPMGDGPAKPTEPR
jgi:hypothetical protein